ncbi:MAG: flagellar hook-basal body complex protein FliE [Nevskiaceae bacterium]|nr:MAG: flagellar hook-basal body complex protein FliE [Nevskiaceae bacterium]TAM26261.1 MAG: flagellar hook-basal body complex protein FliE [Nevskiaceae bacterium]
MNDIGINQVLAQIRTLNAASARAPAATDNGKALADFSNTLGKAVDGVASAQNTAADLSTRFELGDKSVDLASVMIAGARAQVNFRAAVEVRNRVVAAYQDIMNMPI